MIFDSLACLNIFFSLTDSKLVSNISESTLPGPTDGNWSLSPTKIIAVFSPTAFNRLFIR